jgi:hypothetical protein
MSQETPKEEPPRSRIFIGIDELSTKQRGAVLGLLKDIGFAPGEIKEVVVQLPEGDYGDRSSEPGGRKRK